MSAKVGIVLDDDQLNNLKKQIYDSFSEAIEQAKSDSGLVWMRRKQLIEYLPVKDSTVDKYIDQFPFHVLGGMKFYNRFEVDKILMSK